MVRPVLLSSDDVKRRSRAGGSSRALAVFEDQGLYITRVAVPQQRTRSGHLPTGRSGPGVQVYLKASELCQSRTEIYDGGDLKRVAEAVFSLGLYVFGMYIVMFGLDVEDVRSISPCAVGAR